MARIVPPVGNHKANIALVGEAPGKEEELRLKPFVGPAGNILDRALRAAGISRDACYITNVVKVRPPNNDFKSFNMQDLEYWKNALRDELNRIQPNVIVALGERALNALTGMSGVLKYRGSILYSTLCEGLKVVCAEHPAFLLPNRNPSDFHLLVFDLQRAKEESLSKDFPTLPREMLTNPSYEEVLHHLDLALERPDCILDVETDRKQKALLCIGLSYKDGHAICIPLGPSCKVWTEQEELEIWRRLQKVLTCERIGKIGQNIGFDMTILYRYVGEIYPVSFDTMLAHSLLHIEDPHSLAHLTSIYTKYPYYKSDKENLWEYNCIDCIVTRAVYKEMSKEIDEHDMGRVFYGYTMPLFKILWRMERFGCRIDTNKKELSAVEVKKEIEELKKAINKEVGFELNVNSPKQMQHFLYEYLMLPVKRNRKTRRVTADENAINELAVSHPNPVFDKVLELRGKIKDLSTYIDAKVDKDGRMRTAYSMTGADKEDNRLPVTGRLASRKGIYGSGMDLQNIPTRHRSMFLPDDGMILVEADLSQAENRVVAYLAGDEKQIDIFERGGDFHSIMATWLGKDRKVAKSIVHGTNYGMKKRLLSQITGLSQGEAEDVRLKYFKTCPKIAHWQLGIQSKLKADRTLVTPLGRRRVFFGMLGDEMFRRAYAYIPQSTVADWLNINLVALYYRLKGKCDVLLQVHDSVLLQCNPDVLDDVINAICELMQRPFKIHGRMCSIPVEVKIGKNWCDMETFNETTVERDLVR